MNLPVFAIVGVRAVKAVRHEDGGFGIYVYDRKTQTFQHDFYFYEALFERGDDTERVSEQDFDRYVKSLQKQQGATTRDQQ